MVLIKNMEMPEGCFYCRFNDCGACTAVHEAYKQVILIRKGQKFPEDCPLTEVMPYGPEGTLYKEKNNE